MEVRGGKTRARRVEIETLATDWRTDLEQSYYGLRMWPWMECNDDHRYVYTSGVVVL